jgi:anti-sigma factor RsiW
MIVAEHPSDLSAEDEADLVAYVDGRLDAPGRTRVEARAGSDPVYAAALARQREGHAAISRAAETTCAPLALRSRVEAMGAGRERRHGARGPSVRTRLGGIRWPAAGAVAVGVAAVLAAVMLAGGGPGIDDVAAAAVRPPAAAVALVPPGSKLLSEHYDGVAFPNYAGKFGWRATGTRTDDIGGRDTRTVFYEKGGRRIAYTVVGGDALSWPGGAQKATREGTPLRALKTDGRTVVTLRRRGHTCVLSATDVPRSELLELAGWKGKGAVAF